MPVEQIVDRVVGATRRYGQPGDGPVVRELLPALPQQDAADRVVPGDRVEQVSHLPALPDELALELGQQDVARLDPLGQRGDALHGRLGIPERRASALSVVRTPLPSK